MIKKSIKFIIIMTIMFLLTGCTSEPLDVNELRENEEVISYFAERNLSITDIKLEKRQTNKEDKEDIAYVYIKAEREEAILEGVYIIKSSYFDKGGWNVMSINCDEGGTYKPTDIVKYDITQYDYSDATSIEYTGHEITQYDKEQGDIKCNLYFTVKHEGEFASISENYSIELRFDIYDGMWKKNDDVTFVDGEYELFVEDGIYTYQNAYVAHPTLFELTFTDVDAQLTVHEWSDYNKPKGYREYYLGISNYHIEDGGIVLEEFSRIYGEKQCIKICVDKIYFGRSGYNNDNVDYGSELIRLE